MKVPSELAVVNITVTVQLTKRLFVKEKLAFTVILRMNVLMLALMIALEILGVVLENNVALFITIFDFCNKMMCCYINMRTSYLIKMIFKRRLQSNDKIQNGYV